MMAVASLNVQADEFSKFVDDQGVIELPNDFRKAMVHLGSWYVPDGEASGFHDVYTQAATVTHFRETGEFPDGAVLVKELRGAESGNYTTGKGVSYATDSVKQWFVMIKDRKNRFPGNPNWGEGWGWALYKEASAGNVSTEFRRDCLGCHIPAKENDWIYVEAYPTLLTLEDDS
ncbi:MAG: cytochrome P460 family protein [Pseudomonadales bacterium]|nr:cytochrome P460 family protein [Pseudomonadales bacterium]MBO6565588.1 cytochrome P460 family protein [Pseudomonadales bacterium]MBO6594630.1 cytochrome P460 family protein [Pseudomonadales bacterium]MBO6655442.1 cytochrome P460 family protein [Pseudomonadales bacterium]MBO6701137.1 cytochrome P460 family protein [Pseudomonadales bacterium]